MSMSLGWSSRGQRSSPGASTALGEGMQQGSSGIVQSWW